MTTITEKQLIALKGAVADKSREKFPAFRFGVYAGYDNNPSLMGGKIAKALVAAGYLTEPTYGEYTITEAGRKKSRRAAELSNPRHRKDRRP